VDKYFASDIDLFQLLMETKKGNVVWQNRANLSNSNRQVMCQIIVDHFIENDVTMGVAEFKQMQQKILRFVSF